MHSTDYVAPNYNSFPSQLLFPNSYIQILPCPHTTPNYVAPHYNSFSRQLLFPHSYIQIQPHL